MEEPPVIAIVGPTAVGKTTLSLALAARLPVEIVSVDSRQVYRGMDIGTAKPTPEQRTQASHHLIDVVEPTQEFSLATYLELARAAIQEIHQRGRLPLLVGGTGQYLWALLEAWRVPAVPQDAVFRQEMTALVQEKGLAALVERLAQVDPNALSVVDTRNPRRAVRALEVYHQTGVPFSAMRRRGPEPYRSLVLGLTVPREELYRRIDQRVDGMLAAGWVEEVRRLLGQGITTAHPAMASVGYRELAAYLEDSTGLEEVVRRIKVSTHRFARHQYAWFRARDPRIRWLDASRDVEAQAVSMVHTFLAEPSGDYGKMQRL